MNLKIKDNSQTSFLRNQWEDGWLFMLKFFVWVKYTSLSPVSAWEQNILLQILLELYFQHWLFRERNCKREAKFSNMLNLWLHNFLAVFLFQHARQHMSGILLAWKGLGWNLIILGWESPAGKHGTPLGLPKVCEVQLNLHFPGCLKWRKKEMIGFEGG